jgi:glycosyltransferase involved in cell wall biosynthesis
MSSKTMHRIVLFNSDLSGGAGKFIITLAKALKRMHAEVHIIVYSDNIDYVIPEGIHFHLLKQNGQRIDGKKEIVQALKYKIDEIGKVDFLMSNSSPANRLMSMLTYPNIYHCVHSAETKVYKGFVGFFKEKWRKVKYKRLYSHKNLITVSKGLETYILENIRAKPESIQTIYNPFDFEEIHRLAEESVNEIPDTSYLIHVGRFDMVSKRHDILLKAYKQANVSQKLVLLGEGEDKIKIETLVQELGLQSKVLFQGYTDNPYVWLKHAELLVLSSDFEGFGRVLAEALIVGTPVVSTDCPSGPSEILTGSLKEFLVPPGDANGLALKIRQALQQYPDIEKIDMRWLRDDVIAKEYMVLIDSLPNIHYNKGDVS